MTEAMIIYWVSVLGISVTMSLRDIPGRNIGPNDSEKLK
jgi:hypothetical protein